LHGLIFIAEVGGFHGGYTPENLIRLAHVAKKHEAHIMVVESNFGDGMFSELLKPVLKSIHPCTVEEVRVSKQKELRIIDIVEPLLNQHKLVIDYSLLKQDIKAGVADHTKLSYSLIHQLTHVTKDRGSLYHDDRLDALALALGFIVENVGVSTADALEKYREEQLDKELESFMNGIGVGGRSKKDNYLNSYSTLF
jgi:phage terminase large subunit-like protein